MWRRWACIGAGGLLIAAAARAQTPPSFGPPPGIRYEVGIPFGKGGDVELKLDLAMPAQVRGRLPAVVCIHGGHWRTGRRELCGPMTFFLAEAGYVAVTVSYRLAPAHPFPAQLEDVKCAVRWLRANAETYHVDPDRIGAFGLSSGGHLAMMLAATDPSAGFEGTGGFPKQSSRVQAAVSYGGALDLTAKYWQRLTTGMLVDFLGAPYAEAPERYRQASPIEYLDAPDPPVLLFHGDKDYLVPMEQAERFVAKLKDAGGSARLRVVQEAGHVWIGDNLVNTRRETIAFFDTHLRPRDRAPARASGTPGE